MEHNNQYLFGDNVNLWLWWSKSPALYYAEATSISTQPCRHFSGVTTRYKLGEGILLAGFLSRPVVKDCELSPPIRSCWRHSYQPLPFRSRSPIQLNPKREREREGEGEREGEIYDSTPQRLQNTILDGFPYVKDDVPAAFHPSHSSWGSNIT